MNILWAELDKEFRDEKIGTKKESMKMKQTMKKSSSFTAIDR